MNKTKKKIRKNKKVKNNGKFTKNKTKKIYNSTGNTCKNLDKKYQVIFIKKSQIGGSSKEKYSIKLNTQCRNLVNSLEEEHEKYIKLWKNS